MAAEHQYFYEDEVYRLNKKGNIEFGMVLENSELVSSDDNSDVEEGGKMKKGHIRVAWHPTGEEEVIPEKKVGLADRSLMPGDVVRRMVKGKDTQRGYCRKIKVTACVQVLGTKHVIMNIKSEDLIPLEEFGPDIAVCMDSWVGGIKMAHSKLVLQFSDGSRCVVNDPDTFGLDVFDEKRDIVCTLSRNILKGCEFPHRGDYYPGQTLWGPLHPLEEAQWLVCSKELRAQLKSHKTVKVAVESVETESVAVRWQCRAYSKEGAGNDKEQPKPLIRGEDLNKLKLLNVFEPCTLQVGDRNFYIFKEGDVVTTKEQWRKSQKDIILSNASANGFQPPLIPYNPPKRRNKRHSFRVPSSNLIITVKSSIDEHSVESATQTNMHSVESATQTNTTELTANVNKKDNRLTIDGVCNNTSSSTESFGGGAGAGAVGGGQLTVNCQDTNAVEPPKLSPNESVKGDEWDTDSGSEADYGSDTGSNASSTASSTGSTRRKGPLALMTKMLKKKKLRRARKKPPPLVLKPGSKIVVEALSTASSADVVWQDGSVEKDIPSTQLYPIHHLDDQEFFPGDFVIENREDGCMRVYGVVQSVDHAGRTADIKWFRTYTSTDNPQPCFLQENEVSVYDLKDHPDFQYRPGTVVIRVANFEGEDANCTAGQVLDNYPEGKVLVWWVDGHISMCWPQDLYKVGEYDSDEGELWDDGSSEASWETESEDYCIAEEENTVEGTESLKPKLAANIEKARVAMSRLEEIFTQNPALQTTDVMRKLLDVYKDCRYLDKLMGTTFFHESHFQGLLERVRERGRANVAQRVADQVSRLFNQPEPGSDLHLQNSLHVTADGELESQQISESSNSNSDSGVMSGSPPSSKEALVSSEFLNENLASLELRIVTAANNSKNAESNKQHRTSNSPRVINDAEVMTDSKHKGIGKTQRQESDRTVVGKSSRIISDGPPEACCDHKLIVSSEMKQHSNKSLNSTDNPSNNGCCDSDHPYAAKESSSSAVCNSHVCVKLCSLILAQLVKAHTEVVRRFGGNSQGGMTLSDAANTVSPSGSNEPDIDDTTKQLVTLEDPASPTSPVSPTTSLESNIAVSSAAATLVAKASAQSVDSNSIPIECDNELPISNIQKEGEGFSILDTAPNSHRFKLTMFQPTDQKTFFKTVRNEIKLLRTSLPQGIWVKGFEDRMDLYSVMIRGPEKTPYEDGLFFFDFQLSADYPKAPPLCHYISYCSDRLNPNLYEDGKVCVSLLGTWSGKGTEVWTLTSNLMQVIVSIQGLILVSEPYFNEAGYEKQKGSQQGRENSRMYNEMVILKLVQSMTKLILNPPLIFKEHITEHFSKNAQKFCARLTSWLEVSERYNASHPLSPTTPNTFKEIHVDEVENVPLPEFSLIPASKGFCLTLRKSLATFKEVLASMESNISGTSSIDALVSESATPTTLSDT
ncbi:(E3-independent) E2 ubiquitin-conjugating enzyme UBE2O isoform X3 [Lycorma delicatula]|uniref:(E3-independent) E2 ubiquitin-conjugating enzyme UBE2O isoform X3 n=1 Tax=Lycorma delicatula TaxID=130591 RepID=UPI003F5126C7